MAHIPTVPIDAVGDLPRSTCSTDDLRMRFPCQTVTAVMQCAGNRRADIQPYGRWRDGTETQVKVVATKSIGSFWTSYVPRRLHLNATWFHNYDPLRVCIGRSCASTAGPRTCLNPAPATSSRRRRF